MKDLCIQIHPDRVAGLDMKAVRSRCEAVAGNPLVSRFAINEGTDNGRYVNVMFETADTSALWKLLWRDVCGDPVFGEPLRLASGMITCCCITTIRHSRSIVWKGPDCSAGLEHA